MDNIHQLNLCKSTEKSKEYYFATFKHILWKKKFLDFQQCNRRISFLVRINGLNLYVKYNHLST